MRYSILSILLLTNTLFIGCTQQNTPSVPTTVAIPQAYHEEGSWKKATPNDNAVRGAWWEKVGLGLAAAWLRVGGIPCSTVSPPTAWTASSG